MEKSSFDFTMLTLKKSSFWFKDYLKSFDERIDNYFFVMEIILVRRITKSSDRRKQILYGFQNIRVLSVGASMQEVGW